MTNQGATATSSNQGQASYNLVPTTVPDTTTAATTYSRPQEPYNPNFTTNTSSSYAPPPAYSGNIANTPVI